MNGFWKRAGTFFPALINLAWGTQSNLALLTEIGVNARDGFQCPVFDRSESRVKACGFPCKAWHPTCLWGCSAPDGNWLPGHFPLSCENLEHFLVNDCLPTKTGSLLLSTNSRKECQECGGGCHRPGRTFPCGSGLPLGLLVGAPRKGA